jgi:hypothetical protein
MKCLYEPYVYSVCAVYSVLCVMCCVLCEYYYVPTTITSLTHPLTHSHYSQYDFSAIDPETFGRLPDTSTRNQIVFTALPVLMYMYPLR